MQSFDCVHAGGFEPVVGDDVPILLPNCSLSGDNFAKVGCKTGLAVDQDDFSLEQVLRLSGSYLGGMITAADELGWDLTGLLFANTQPSGTIADVAYESMRDEILARLRDAMPVDVVGIENHGAGVAG